MTRQASRFTPEVMLSAPRRSPGAPNSTGELILYTVSWHINYSLKALLTHRQISTYSFETHSVSSQIRVLNIKDDSSHVITDDTHDTSPFWIGEKEVGFIRTQDNGISSLYYSEVSRKFE